MKLMALIKSTCFLSCLVVAGHASDHFLPHRIKHGRRGEGVRAASSLKNMASPGGSSASFVPEKRTGFGSGEYNRWKVGDYVDAISASPDGFVYGIFSMEPARFNLQTNELESPGSLTSDQIANNIHRTPSGSVVVVGEHLSIAPVPGSISIIDETNFAYVSSATIPVITGYDDVNPLAVASDSNGSIYVGGYSTHDGSILDEGTSAPWLRKFDSDLNELDVNVMSSEGEIYDLTMGNDGHVYACGIRGPYDESDIWVGKFDSDLQLIDEAIINTSGGGADKAFSLKFASNDDLYVVGSVYEVKGGTNAWIGRFNKNLDLADSVTSVGALDGTVDAYTDIEIVGNRVYVTGIRGSDDKIVSENPTREGDMDFVIASYTKGLDLVSEHSVQGDAHLNDAGVSLSSDNNGKLYVAGFTEDATTTFQSGEITYEWGIPSGWLSQHNIGSAPVVGEKPLAYPNPFRLVSGHGVMSIDNLPDTGTLKLFTLKGELVREIPFTLGSALWDAKNAAGESVNSGVYYGVVDGQGSNKSFKVVVQR